MGIFHLPPLSRRIIPPASFWSETMTDKPDYLVRTTKDLDGKKIWIDMGVGYKNKTNTITVYLSSLPFNDKILLIPIGREYFGLENDLKGT
jgi:hypothetical protein